MGIQDRKRKQKENLKQSILDAAKKILVKEGYSSTSIRKIAAEIEFSPTTIYLYYKDKNDIIYALHQEGFELLKEKMKVLQLVSDPLERLKALGRAYIQFSLEQPEFYALMFIMKEPLEFVRKECATNLWPEGIHLLDSLEATIQECQSQGYFPAIPSQLMAIQAWTTVHGLSALNTTGHLTHVMETLWNKNDKNEEVLDQCFNVYIQFIEKYK